MWLGEWFDWFWWRVSLTGRFFSLQLLRQKNLKLHKTLHPQANVFLQLFLHTWLDTKQSNYWYVKLSTVCKNVPTLAQVHSSPGVVSVDWQLPWNASTRPASLPVDLFWYRSPHLCCKVREGTRLAGVGQMRHSLTQTWRACRDLLSLSTLLNSLLLAWELPATCFPWLHLRDALGSQTPSFDRLINSPAHTRKSFLKSFSTQRSS